MSVDRVFGMNRRSEEEHWISVADLMAGLMVIFLFIAISYIRPIENTQDTIRTIAAAWNESEADIYAALKQEFRGDFSRWNAELERETLTVRFKAPEVLFDKATPDLKPKFREILSSFFPRYLRVLEVFRDAIEEVRVEGHTSSIWEGAVSAEDAYFKNMELSQARTRSVLEFALQLPASEPFREWASRHLTATGLSSSRPILNGGVEDRAKSRRVEFRVRTNAKRQVVKIIETLEIPESPE